MIQEAYSIPDYLYSIFSMLEKKKQDFYNGNKWRVYVEKHYYIVEKVYNGILHDKYRVKRTLQGGTV